MGSRSTRSPIVACLAIAVAFAGCTIERSRQLGDDCLMDRECAASLRCQITPAGVSRCVAVTRFDVTLLPGVDATSDITPEAAPPDIPPPPPDVPPPPPDVPPPPPDVPPVDVPPPRDVPAAPDVTPDVAPDVTPDVAPDAAVDVTDAADGGG